MNSDDPQYSQPKKGLSGLAIAGIGCGALLLLIIAVFAFIGLKAMNKMKEVAGDDWRKNPAKTAALVAAKMNPEWDFVKVDDAQGEITVKVKKTGEEITMAYNEVAQGKFTMKNSNGEETVYGTAASAPPAWVPAYPAAVAQGAGMRTEKPEGVSGTYMVQTKDAAAKVSEFFEAKLKADGFTTVATASAGGAAVVNAKNEADQRTVTVQISGDQGATQMVITYEGPK